MITKLSPEQIDTSSAPDGSSLKVESGVASFQVAGASDPVGEFDTKYSFDSETGTLSILYADGRQQIVSGFIRSSDLRQSMQGEPGLPGTPGTPGKDGRPGRDGLPGCRGRKGDRGRMGPTGGTGPRGATGNTGSTGDLGPTGPDGPPGKDAIAPEYTVVPYVDPDTETPYAHAYVGYDHDLVTQRTINSGRVIARALRDTINVTFLKPFENRVLNVNITFFNANTNQAKTYRLYNHAREDGSFENSMLGGFVIKCIGMNVEDWDFNFIAMGD